MKRSFYILLTVMIISLSACGNFQDTTPIKNSVINYFYITKILYNGIEFIIPPDNKTTVIPLDSLFRMTYSVDTVYDIIIDFKEEISGTVSVLYSTKYNADYLRAIDLHYIEGKLYSPSMLDITEIAIKSGSRYFITLKLCPYGVSDTADCLTSSLRYLTFQ